jgi:hypothetical protein
MQLKSKAIGERALNESFGSAQLKSPSIIVKPEYNDQSWAHEIVTVVDRCSLFRSTFIPGTGNYFCPRATLSLFKCLADQIPVKKAIIKLKICSPRARRGPRAVCCQFQSITPVGMDMNQSNIYTILRIFRFSPREKDIFSFFISSFFIWPNLPSFIRSLNLKKKV